MALDEDKVSHLKLLAWGSPLVGIFLLLLPLVQSNPYER
jgi:hypothetical protein